MATPSLSHQERIDAGLGFLWDTLPERSSTAADILPDAQDVVMYRIKQSHQGIGGHRHIRRLWAHAVNQAFLEEIAQLDALETLYMTRVSASDLTPRRNLSRLQSLSVIDATKVADLSWLPETPTLRALAMENLKQVTDIDALASLTQLKALAVEGSMWTAMRVTSLTPLGALTQLQYLFLTHLRVADKSLAPLQNLAGLRALQCANFYPAAEFAALAEARPQLRCDWFAGTSVN
jgi:Leucine-rich repeat (LRR) protein